MEVPILLKMGDGISTDGILKAGSEALALRSNIPEISKYCYSEIDGGFYERSLENRQTGRGFCVVAGENYAQGSSREHAALAPRYLGQLFVIAKSYARIGWQNLVNFGIIPFEFQDPADWDKLGQGDVLRLNDVRSRIRSGEPGGPITAEVVGKGLKISMTTRLSARQVEILSSGGIINWMKRDGGKS
jgi:aconitate hydratase